jgi:hypothetical protein
MSAPKWFGGVRWQQVGGRRAAAFARTTACQGVGGQKSDERFDHDLGFIRDSPESLSPTVADVPCISSFPIPRLSAGVAIDKIDIMKITKNIGMLLLAVYLIIDGLLGFGLQLGPAIFLLYLVALAAGIFILIGK